MTYREWLNKGTMTMETKTEFVPSTMDDLRASLERMDQAAEQVEAAKRNHEAAVNDVEQTIFTMSDEDVIVLQLHAREFVREQATGELYVRAQMTQDLEGGKLRNEELAPDAQYLAKKEAAGPRLVTDEEPS